MKWVIAWVTLFATAILAHAQTVSELQSEIIQLKAENSALRAQLTDYQQKKESAALKPTTRPAPAIASKPAADQAYENRKRREIHDAAEAYTHAERELKETRAAIVTGDIDMYLRGHRHPTGKYYKYQSQKDEAVEKASAAFDAAKERLSQTKASYGE